MSKKEAYEIADAVLTQSIYDLNIWMNQNPNDVELICGCSERLSEGDFIRIFNVLVDINALNILSLFVFRHIDHIQKNFHINLDSIGDIVSTDKT